MSKTWIRSKTPEFVRDVLRDFCMVHKTLESHFQDYDTSGEVDFEFIRNILGEEMNKGQLWRLKDTAHLLFRKTQDVPLVGKFLDWGIGYIFHECIKLKEDAYQRQNYGPWFEELKNKTTLRPEERNASEDMGHVITQTHESIRREISRIRFILGQCRRMFSLFLPDHRENQLLARFLFERTELIQTVFGNEYASLLQSIYRVQPEEMYILAAKSLRRGGWLQQAGLALDRAETMAPNSISVLQERERIDKRRSSVKIRPHMSS